MKPMTAYGVVHYLLRIQRGAAKDNPCVECGGQARHWAYDHKDVFERTDPDTDQVFSVNFNHYQPMCPTCHHQLDKANFARVTLALIQRDAVLDPHSPADSGCSLPSASVGQMSQLTEGVTC